MVNNRTEPILEPGNSSQKKIRSREYHHPCLIITTTLLPPLSPFLLTTTTTTIIHQNHHKHSKFGIHRKSTRILCFCLKFFFLFKIFSTIQTFVVFSDEFFFSFQFGVNNTPTTQQNEQRERQRSLVDPTKTKNEQTKKKRFESKKKELAEKNKNPNTQPANQHKQHMKKLSSTLSPTIFSLISCF